MATTVLISTATQQTTARGPIDILWMYRHRPWELAHSLKPAGPWTKEYGLFRSMKSSPKGTVPRRLAAVPISVSTSLSGRAAITAHIPYKDSNITSREREHS
jgi:hypothetical protein